MEKGNVLILEDDENLRMIVESYLEGESYRVVTSGTIADAKQSINDHEFDVILLDLTLPDGEGLTFIPQIKPLTDAGIIVVSGKSDTTEKIVCLEMGADDYITKPFEMRELTARIKAVTRRSHHEDDHDHNSKESDGDIIKFGDGWKLDRSQYQLFDKNGQSADLTTGEFQLLEALVLAPNRALSRERLFDLTRDGHYDSYDRAIDIQIGRLRKKMGDDDSNAEIIKTVRGVGYMFTG